MQNQQNAGNNLPTYLCPLDLTPCKPETKTLRGRKFEAFVCSICKGGWAQNNPAQEPNRVAPQKPPSSVNLKNRLCPRCQFPLHICEPTENAPTLAQCFHCSLAWLPAQALEPDQPNPKQSLNLKGKLRASVSIYALAIGATGGLWAWQRHSLAASADYYSFLEKSNPSHSLLSAAIWLVILFSLVILPLILYLQVRLQATKTSQALSRPATTFVPLIAIILALINVLIIIPAF